ncbi:MAG TPA: TIM-barrel domain-containing protein, partial [Bdellovibrionales bacterium]|nr:TIM-barrel domain-containing protein [Bdellovibrionales bacterium]
YMALNLGLSGVGNSGHDIGGFSGPRPSPELFLRWIQHGIFYPRFVIHSWKAEGVNEPWMYPEIVPQIRKLFELRESLSAYFYQVLKRSHDTFEPFLRPLFFDFETDRKSFEAKDVFMVGPDLLVANVLDEGVKTREVYLPQNDGGWFEFSTGKHFEGGRAHTLKVDLESVPFFVRSGSVLPIKTAKGIELRIYSDGRSKFASSYFDDDGMSFPFRERDGIRIQIDVDGLQVKLLKVGEFPAPEMMFTHVSGEKVKT